MSSSRALAVILEGRSLGLEMAQRYLDLVADGDLQWDEVEKPRQRNNFGGLGDASPAVHVRTGKV